MAVKRKACIPEDEMNVTPLIDCVFLLLIFFMVTTVFKNPAKLTTILPMAENYSKLDKRQLICELDKDGNIALNGSMVTLDSFDAYLVSQKQETGTNSLVIRADVAAKHGEVLKLMTIARSVQIETIAIAVDIPVKEE